jgi:hypothetical protein
MLEHFGSKISKDRRGGLKSTCECLPYQVARFCFTMDKPNVVGASSRFQLPNLRIGSLFCPAQGGFPGKKAISWTAGDTQRLKEVLLGEFVVEVPGSPLVWKNLDPQQFYRLREVLAYERYRWILVWQMEQHGLGTELTEALQGIGLQKVQRYEWNLPLLAILDPAV